MASRFNVRGHGRSMCRESCETVAASDAERALSPNARVLVGSSSAAHVTSLCGCLAFVLCSCPWSSSALRVVRRVLELNLVPRSMFVMCFRPLEVECSVSTTVLVFFCIDD